PWRARADVGCSPRVTSLLRAFPPATVASPFCNHSEAGRIARSEIVHAKCQVEQLNASGLLHSTTGLFAKAPSLCPPCSCRSCPVAKDPMQSVQRALSFRLSVPVSAFHWKAPRTVSTHRLSARARALYVRPFRERLRDTGSDS